MTEVFAKVEKLAEHAKEYVNLKMDSLKLTTAEKSSAVLSNLIAGAIVAFVFIFFLVFASIAGAIAISDWIGKQYAGFLIVAGVYLLLAIIVWLSKDRMIRIPIMNKIIHQLFKDEGDDEKD